MPFLRDSSKMVVIRLQVHDVPYLRDFISEVHVPDASKSCPFLRHFLLKMPYSWHLCLMDLIDELLVHAREVIYHTESRPMTSVLDPRWHRVSNDTTPAARAQRYRNPPQLEPDFKRRALRGGVARYGIFYLRCLTLPVLRHAAKVPYFRDSSSGTWSYCKCD